MIIETKRSRRAFIGAAAVGMTLAGAYAATHYGASLIGDESEGGMVSSVELPETAATAVADTADAWRSAIGSAVRIAGESGLVEGRILTVADGAMGGKRPAGLRPEAILVYFETALATAPVGDAIYRVESTIESVGDLFLTRGQDVYDKAVLLAVLN